MNGKIETPVPLMFPGRVINVTPKPQPATYIGAGGLVRVEVTPGAHLDSLRQARRFIDGLIEDVQTAPNRST